MTPTAALSHPVATLNAAARPFGIEADDDELLAWLGDTSLVLLGEASHGTHEFYEARARLSRKLIEEKGFTAVAVEGDWPDAYHVNRYVQGHDGRDARAALAGFERFPTWMWRNTVVAEFIDWLRQHNSGLPKRGVRTGFYGLDLYSLRRSMRAVIDYLQARDPQQARAARASYGCFDQFGEEGQSYGWAASRLGGNTCEEEVTAQLVALHQRQAELLKHDGSDASDDYFYAEQNARVARNAERYYRSMFHGRISSWNIRDEHMAEILAELKQHLRRRHGRDPKIVVWAHNSHLGDARATEMGGAGELNLGQLARERYGPDVRSLGFTTYAGTVLAASDWDGQAEVKRVRPALRGSFEELFHDMDRRRFFLPIAPGSEVHELLDTQRLERAIGVIYRPETERHSHYFHARLSSQFDAIIHFDTTRALVPLDAVQRPSDDEPPETFPEGV
jgi:erythromycin esterase-like protein